MQYRVATLDDAPLLAEMNQCLILDEGHQNRMSLDELTQRMRGWLEKEYRAVIFDKGDTCVGYALFKEEPAWVYLRQFFIRKECRRQGLGRAAIVWLSTNVWSQVGRVRLDVLVNNSTGIAFWKTLDFTEYCLTMERALPK
ncbi:MAG TPA: GNAT family N-acetyltransferase [Pirellulales bacterium]|nr:GNAT family N-acetyltransferase [Pirellulales bacterium]